MRIVLAALSFILLAQAPAYALDARDLVGRWTTEWSSGPGLPGNQTNVWITPDADVNSLDGVWEAPGTNGLLFGTLSRRDDDGALVWSGRWTAPPEMAEEASGEPMGGEFEFVFTSRRTFTGTWSSDGGAVSGAPWSGHR